MHSPSEPKLILLVSGSTGNTAETALRTALRQFSGALVDLRTFPKMNDIKRLEAVFRLARMRQAMIAITLVDMDLNAAAHRYAATYDVPIIDLLSDLVLRLSKFLAQEPTGIPGRRATGADYFRRVEAVEFTVDHDDGANPHDLHRADIVLVGISRTSKTPLSSYLAHRGWRVANVPLVPGIDPPKQLDELDPARVFGLLVNPEILAEIRLERMRDLGIDKDAGYGRMDRIMDELEFAKRLYRTRRWRMINVSHKALEETAAEIERTLQKRLGLSRTSGDSLGPLVKR